MHAPRRPLLALVLLSVLAAAVGCSRSPMGRAQAFLDAGMADEAVPLLQMQIQANPRTTRAHLLMGRAQLQLDNPAAARECFGRVVMLEPGWADRVGAEYVRAAEHLLADGKESSVRTAADYLTCARSRTHTLDAAIAQGLRNAGIRLSSGELLRAAIAIAPNIAREDSVAWALIDLSKADNLLAADLTSFLAQFPKSPVRADALETLASLYDRRGARDQVKICCEQILRITTSGRHADLARSMLAGTHPNTARDELTADRTVLSDIDTTSAEFTGTYSPPGGSSGAAAPAMVVGTITSIEPQGNTYLSIELRTSSGTTEFLWCTGDGTKVHGPSGSDGWSQLTVGRVLRATGSRIENEGKSLLEARRIDVIR